MSSRKSWSGLIAWLEKQPADKPYVYGDARNCLAAQYNRHVGKKYNVHPVPIKASGRESFDVRLERLAVETSPRTFGNALELAKERQLEDA